MLRKIKKGVFYNRIWEHSYFNQKDFCLKMNGSYSYQDTFIGYGKIYCCLKNFYTTSILLDMSHTRFDAAWSLLLQDCCYGDEINGK